MTNVSMNSSLSLGERDALSLMEAGEEALLRQMAMEREAVQIGIVNRGRVRLRSDELGNLHSQLQSLTVQCTLIVGFGLASIGADTLSQLSSVTVGSSCMGEGGGGG